MVISLRQFGQCGFINSIRKKASRPVRRPERVIPFRHLGADVVAHLVFGMFETAEEIIEVGMRAPWDAAPALRLTPHDCDLHGHHTLSRRMLRAECAGAFTGPADGPNTTNAQKPSHNATPVQTRVVVMMCSRQTGRTQLAVICANQGSPEEYGFRLQF
ncbi:hypothetical protein QA641_18595 [Bradyrhizobium sp. CB1650]|uniref:hypothetical protein n=1 Tax=Bradyrhizobium sp. CB1650 TaxID=3039153 RepID=UPI002434B8ED|nr:hypothetical protein [Bradyrhizobium sp. CB1650]WGD55712.1 hypothetical protein QA641_18595 [Bradyrhizobium sp. CB1650]